MLLMGLWYLIWDVFPCKPGAQWEKATCKCENNNLEKSARPGPGEVTKMGHVDPQRTQKKTSLAY